MLAEHISWRQSVGLDLIEDWSWPARRGDAVIPRLLVELRVPSAELAALKRARQFTFHKTDRSGRPMFYDRLGQMDIAALLQVTTIDRLIQHFVWHQEATLVYRLPSASLHHGSLVHKSVFILDLDGFSLRVFSAETRKLLRIVAEIGANHYPTSMEVTYIVNAPMSFRAVWAFMTPLLPARVISAFVILGGREQYLPRLIAEHCDEADIPAFLGGGDTSCDFVQEKGPWAEYLPPLAGE